MVTDEEILSAYQKQPAVRVFVELAQLLGSRSIKLAEDKFFPPAATVSS